MDCGTWEFVDAGNSVQKGKPPYLVAVSDKLICI